MNAVTISRTKLRDLQERLVAIAGAHPSAVLASSFSPEDMLLTDLIDRAGLGISVFTLDTGRLPEETQRLMHLARSRYRTAIAVYAPDSGALERYIAAHGPNAFYESVDLRLACCHVRKVEPLGRALAGKSAWLTGQRREQSATRRDLPFAEWDEGHGMHKFNPLADWTTEEVWNYVKANDVPYNALHDQGYVSIGCAPCTRAVEPGEDIRAGRWWWENADAKECGLHNGRRKQ